MALSGEVSGPTPSTRVAADAVSPEQAVDEANARIKQIVGE